MVKPDLTFNDDVRPFKLRETHFFVRKCIITVASNRAVRHLGTSLT